MNEEINEHEKLQNRPKFIWLLEFYKGSIQKQGKKYGLFNKQGQVKQTK